MQHIGAMFPFGLIRVLMTIKELIETIQRLLSTDVNLDFLSQLKKQELETLLACIRAATGK